jgi:hypothetical protein
MHSYWNTRGGLKSLAFALKLGFWDADAFAIKVKQACPAAADMTSADLASYWQLLLRIIDILTDTRGCGSYTAHKPIKLPGLNVKVPCHQFLGLYEPGVIMSSIGRMHLVRCKLRQYEAALRQGGRELTIEHCGVSDSQWFARLQSEPVCLLLHVRHFQHQL